MLNLFREYKIYKLVYFLTKRHHKKLEEWPISVKDAAPKPVFSFCCCVSIGYLSYNN